MFPLKDNVPARHPPIALWVVIGINIAVFLLQSAAALSDIDVAAGSDTAWPWTRWSVVPAHFSAIDPTTWYPLVTSQFVHGGFLHVASNLWMLWIFGDNVEDRMGPLRFLAFYLLAGVVAGLIHIVSDPTSEMPTVGASGAIAGVLGAYLLLYPKARVLTLVPVFIFPFLFDLPATFFLGFWFVLQIVNGSLSLLTSTNLDYVAWWAHIGGFVAGLAMCRGFAKRSLHPRRLQPDEWTSIDLWRRMR